MTKQELIEMVGSEERAEQAILSLLKNVKPEFVRACLKAELQEVEQQIKEYEEEGYIYYANQNYNVNWCKPDEPFKDREPGWGFHLTEEEQAQKKECEAKCRKANHLIVKRNSLNVLLYHN